MAPFETAYRLYLVQQQEIFLSTAWLVQLYSPVLKQFCTSEICNKQHLKYQHTYGYV